MSKKLQLKDVRLSFPDLFTAVEFKTGDGKPRFNANFLIPKGSDNDKLIRKAIKEEADEALGKKADGLLAQWAPQSNKYAYADGDLKEYEGYAGNMVLSAHAKARPLVIDKDKSILTPADGKPYSGCYVNAIVDIYIQSGENPGVRCGFSGIQFFRDGDAFAGGRPASLDEFEAIDEGSDADANAFV